MSLELDSSTSDNSERVKEVDNALAYALKEVNRLNYEKEIENLQNTRNCKGISAAVYKLKEKVMGPKEAKPDAIAIEDPVTGNQITEPEWINEISLNICISNMDMTKLN